MTSKLYESFLKKNPSPQERFTLGKSIRKEVDRSSIGQFTLEKKRQGPIDILLSQAKTRIPQYIPIRHARMAADPFAFFRGGLYRWACANRHGEKGLRFQLWGHLGVCCACIVG